MSNLIAKKTTRLCLLTTAVGLWVTLTSTYVAASDLVITALKPGETFLELFNPDTGAFEQEIDAADLTFPIPIKRDLSGMFLIELKGRTYSVGSTFVSTTKEYSVTAQCDNNIHAEAVASSRGIGGEGCE
ncbi:hypothetical protein [Marinobacterium litorale]|uniref:hypothetical protein n=1 Tax=Marinobacterium litorale TaxID=404770 RepID=UPI00047FE4E1|nr:hypothetical protein [Marinobacterium litorale]